MTVEEQCLDDHQYMGYLLGMVSGWKCAEEFIRTMTGQAFMKGDDDLAYVIREYADELNCRHERARMAYDSFKAELKQREGS